MIRSILVSSLALTCAAVTAQNWYVNQPLEVQLSAITVYGGGCFPNIQAILNFPVSGVDGVTYYYKVVGITTDGEYTMVPGSATALMVDDTVHVSALTNMVFNSGEFGGLELEVWAMGTPTTIGQAHPCSQNDLWMSNLLLCNESLNSVISSSCVTELNTGVIGSVNGSSSILFPQTANGFRLQWPGVAMNSGKVVDMQGRTIALLSNGQRSTDLSSFPDGAYIVVMELSNATMLRETFTLVH